MRKEIKVTIPEPCHEDWNLMTPKDQGRHCKVCEKTVVDFTNKTDEYIVKTYEREAKLCGRFKDNQLDRPLAYSRKDSNNFLAVASTALLAYLSFGTSTSYAQGKPIADTTSVSTTTQIKGKIARSILQNKVVSGRVIGINNQPLASVQVVEKGTNNLTVTDKNGNYTIKTSRTATLVFTYPDYQEYEILVEYNNSISVEMVRNDYKVNLSKKITISGVISDENGLPLPSATIVEIGTNNGVATDFDGNYSIEINESAEIEVSYVGYKTKNHKIENANTINISLEPDNTLETVIVGGAFSIYYSDGEIVEPALTPEELAEQKRLNEIRKDNNKKFYLRKFKEARAERKRKRQERRNKKN
ncbi:carboxypeptidase-like regulatory domain-containing protein [Olleya sp. R77988]|uniref:carboxypeptidase-like regulatory domain-containing protein n=1 Tax=Olleya sp. R77988 TaxID=3093875 RepID=UPI0037C8BDBD